jgi:hypothetical protein
MGRGLLRVVLAALPAGIVACGGSAGASADASAKDDVHSGDAGVSVAEADTDAPSLGLAPDTSDVGSAPIIIPAAGGDAGCVVSTNGYPLDVVCFGSDPGPYSKYLVPDAGMTAGQCPTTRDFLPVRGEGSCGYLACGPLLPSAVETFDAGAPLAVDDGGWMCCFVVVQACAP